MLSKGKAVAPLSSAGFDVLAIELRNHGKQMEISHNA